MRESFINDEYVRRNFMTRNPNINLHRKQISEIVEMEQLDPNLSVSQDISIDAVEQPESLPKCWNCEQPGHHWEDCLCDRSIFCYGCGANNIYKPQCGKCSQRRSKNFKKYVPLPEQN